MDHNVSNKVHWKRPTREPNMEAAHVKGDHGSKYETPDVETTLGKLRELTNNDVHEDCGGASGDSRLSRWNGSRHGNRTERLIQRILSQLSGFSEPSNNLA